uniref:Uncharacterized protein n=1 Tax=Magallana gigas TaxID=29159 RepID=K1RBY0_MAGGI
MKPVWILVLVVSALSFIEAQRSLVSLSDVITLMSFIDPNWAKRAFKSNDIPCELCYHEDNVDCMKVYCGGDT